MIHVQYFIGIDEAGRGALAGPVSVGAVMCPIDFDWKEGFALITKRGEPKLRDSKKLSSEQRDILFEYITTHAGLKYASAFVSNDVIDSIGIVGAANNAVVLAIASLDIQPPQVKVLLDAGLYAPAKWTQESFVRGDENIPAISFASIIAKVARDRHMIELSQGHTAYGFDKHKGYGTSEHYRALKLSGMCDIHRRSFCHLA